MTETPETLYHYCSTAAFQSIVEKRELWLTDLSLSNDSLEGKWAIQTGRRYMRSQSTPNSYYSTRILLELLHAETLYLGSCFSSARDLLSQWRGYSSDGRGVCLAFRTTNLKRNPISGQESIIQPTVLSRVIYTKQPLDIEEMYERIEKTLKPHVGDAEIFSSQIDRSEKLSLILYLYRIKNPAFSEEAEWRLAIADNPSKIEGLRFRTHNDYLSPYLPLPFPPDAITEVILGPKHPTPVEKIELFLRQNGCQAPVTKSAASYR